MEGAPRAPRTGDGHRGPRDAVIRRPGGRGVRRLPRDRQPFTANTGSDARVGSWARTAADRPAVRRAAMPRWPVCAAASARGARPGADRGAAGRVPAVRSDPSGRSRHLGRAPRGPLLSVRASEPGREAASESRLTAAARLASAALCAACALRFGSPGPFDPFNPRRTVPARTPVLGLSARSVDMPVGGTP